MQELQELAILIATGFSGGAAYFVVQAVKWILMQKKIVLDGDRAVNVALIVSAVFGLLSTYLSYTWLKIPLPTSPAEWVSLATVTSLAVMGAATTIFKKVNSVK